MCVNCSNSGCGGCGALSVPVGPDGPQGPAGANGTNGSNGTNGVVSITYIEDAFDQTINSATPTVITSMTTSLTSGDYAVWFEGTLHSPVDTTTGFYGIYINGVITGENRSYGLASGVMDTTHRSFVINKKVTITGTQTLDVRMAITAGSTVINRASLMIIPEQ